MHAEFLGISKKERLVEANKAISAMMKEITGVYGFDHKLSAWSLAYADEMDEEKGKTYTLVGLDNMTLIESKMSRDELMAKFSNINTEDILSVGHKIDLLKELLDFIGKEKLGQKKEKDIFSSEDEMPKEIKNMIAGLAKSLAEGLGKASDDSMRDNIKKKKEEKEDEDSDSDFLGELDELL